MLDKLGRAVLGGQPAFLQQQVVAQASKADGDTENVQPSKEIMENAVQGMNGLLKQSDTHLKFEYHEELQEYYVAVVDNVTQEVVKEIPPKKLLDIYAAMTNYLGNLFDERV
ncbi:MAG: flagellar protein FlaG [Bacillus sp. (in: firmicutes)]